jgi:hypothetical protein
MADPSEQFKGALESAEDAVEEMVNIGERSVGDVYSQYIVRAENLAVRLREATEDWKSRRGQKDAW